ncbi:C1QL [Mytilus edulis]|uniref:C1QL n=1 Tax=Mytilus edulis TaxID=6550 RepID=A0A8S3QQB2_MYTED|nr:C1QL [Mytilus edulis]
MDKQENTDYKSGIVAGSVKEMVKPKSNANSRKERLLLQPDNTVNVELVAFYAYMSNPENNPSANHTLIYDVPVTNVGSGYNQVIGVFTAPTKRLLLPQDNIVSDGLVAFYAYMFNPENNPSVHLTLIYDVSVTNVGNGYNHVTGIFTAPTSGVYVFIWVTRVSSGEHPTQLMINNSVYGVIFLRAKNGDDGSVSGTVVAYVTKGDSVFVRVHSTYAGDGQINSNEHGRPSFSGWLLR